MKEKDLFELCPFTQYRIDFYEADLLFPSIACTESDPNVGCVPSADFCRLSQILETMKKANEIMQSVHQKSKKLCEGKALLSTKTDCYEIKILLTKCIRKLNQIDTLYSLF